MADVKIVDIDTSQWNIKDEQARNEIVNLKENFNSLTVYSTSEVKTNKKWIDGKDIYRKVMVFPFASNTQYDIDIVSNLGTEYQIANLSESYIYNKSSYGCRQPWFDNRSTTTAIYLNNGVLTFYTSHPAGTANIVIEYVKP